MTPLIVITRDSKGAEAFKTALNVADDAVVCFSLFDVLYDEKALVGAELSKNIILTSRHAAEYCVRHALVGDTRFYVVGEESAKIIAQHQLGEVVCCAENIQGLLDEIIQQHAKRDYTYLRGEHISQDVRAELLNNNIRIQEYTIYKYEENKSNIKNLSAFLSENQQPLIFPLLSKRTAVLMAGMLFDSKPAVDMYAVGLSKTIIEAVKHHAWAGCVIAEQVNLKSLASACIHCFDRITLDCYEREST